MWLRWFAVAAALTNIPYFMFQRSSCGRRLSGRSYSRPSICIRSSAFIWKGARWFFFRRRTNVLRHGIGLLRPREFVSLPLAGEWKTATAGDAVLTQGKPSLGRLHRDFRSLKVGKNGEDVMPLKPGYLIGTALGLTGEPSPWGCHLRGAGSLFFLALASIAPFFTSGRTCGSLFKA